MTETMLGAGGDLVLRLPEEVRRETLQYRGAVERFGRGEMSPVAFKAHRVTMGLYEQRVTGRFMVRIRLGAGRVTPDQLVRIADLAERHGSGLVHATTREDLQIHDLPLENTPDVVEGLLAAGLSPRGGGGNTVRNVTACPRAGVCPAEVFDVAPCAIAVAEHQLQAPSSYNLPRKFKVAFSGCGRDCAFASVSDVGFFARLGAGGAAGFSVWAGGGLGNRPRTAVRVEEFIRREEIFAVTEAVKRLFDGHGDRANRHQARLRFVLDRVGEAGFVRLYREERARVEAEGLPGRVPALGGDPPGVPASVPAGDRDRIARDLWPERDPGRVTVRVRGTFGHFRHDDLRAIAGAAAADGRGPLRATPDQALLVTGVPRNRVAGLLAALGRPADGADAGADIVTCTGAETCKLGLCLSRNLAGAIDAEVRRRGVRVPADGPVIRISGCPNSCGQHLSGDIGFEGRARRVGDRLVPCYEVLAGAVIREGQARLGERLGVVPARRIPALVAEALAAGGGRETTAKLVAESATIPDPAPDELCRDLGVDVPFSLAGRGPGECGAGVMDVIRMDLAEARAQLKSAEGSPGPGANEALYRATVAAARSLLVAFGAEPRTDREIFDAFRTRLIEPGWVGGEALSLSAAAVEWRMGDRPGLADLLEPAKILVARVEALFASLDASLKFRIPPVTAAPGGQADGTPSRSIDLRGVACPMNFVKAKVALEGVATGEVLEILLDDGEPVQNVPASFTEQGQEVLGVKPGDGHWRVAVRRVR
ncbi:MAG: sulfurtransferase TusA family protein [Candidatus Coatesbacteria bacterium]